MNLAKKKIELGIKKAETAILELECKIAERHEDIKRCEDHIVLQKKRVLELKEEFNQLKE